MSADAQYLVAGEAQVGTNRWMWVVKVMPSLHVPTAAFTIQPASPVFRDQVITFDASASSNPGGSIAAYRWNFGDGTTNAGVTVQHSYSSAGDYEVVLEVLSADGPRSWATQRVEVVGLQLQWQRFYGVGVCEVSGIVEALDGGFVLAGGTDGSTTADAHLWVFKVNRRGLPVWEKFFDGPRDGMEYARALTRGADGGYVMAGDFDASSGRDALLLKVDEDGELAWPMKLFGETNSLNEQALAIAPTTDGGYFLAGVNDSTWPMLIKADADGNEVWTRHYEMENGRVADRVLATPDGGALLFARANAYRHWFIKTDPSGIPVWTNVLDYRDICYWVGHRQPPADGFVVAGKHYEDIWLSFLSPDGVASGSQSWSGPAVMDQDDVAYGAAPTPDAGYILTGNITFREDIWGPRQTELFLLKTDPSGVRVWMETFPGTTNLNEAGDAILTLTNGSYVVLGDDGTAATPPVWLFKLAPNHPPTPLMTLATNMIATDGTLTGDGSGSSDRDGSVVGWEWGFGDGQTGSGSLVSHTYTNAGTYNVRLTVVDDEDAERSVTNTVFVPGVRAGPGFTISGTSITNSPASDPVNYPREGVPLAINWSNSLGFVISGTATSGSTKIFRITFPDPVPEGLILYRLPAWTEMPYTVVDQHTIEVNSWLNAGSYVLPFVLAKAAPLPTISAFRVVAPQFSLSFSTITGYRYRVLQTADLSAPAWQEIKHSRAVGEPATLDFLDGSGASETVYVDLPTLGSTTFFRLQMHEQ
ncbi:MAG: PKD domain-containing protein [Verrucomicrobia bacterium]|nr:PKD domain-containing protein [Verrucomicrobiota bacterium]